MPIQTNMPWAVYRGDLLRRGEAPRNEVLVSGHRMPPGPERARERSRTYAGIAAAMAAQWG